MALDRDAILDALRSRLEESVRSPTEKRFTVTRRDRGFDIANLPVMVVTTDSMTLDELGKWRIEARVNAMVHVPSNEVSPETRLNFVIDEIANALAWQPGESATYGMAATTLGDSCASCDVAGTIDLVQHGDGVGEAVIPVEIIAYEQN